MLRRLFFAIGLSLAMFSNPLYSEASDDQLDCATPTGKEICVAIRKVEINAIPCEGAGCDFYKLIHLMDSATDLYIQSLTITATKQVGDLAYSAADALCHTKFTGDRNVILRLTVSANRFLNAMQEIQTHAELTDTMTCEFETEGGFASALKTSF